MIASVTPGEQQAAALARAKYGQSMMNYGTIIDGFMARGIPADDITPRVNVLTYAAWLAAGRQVRRGEHGVRVVSFIPMTRKIEQADGSVRIDRFRRPGSAVVFHISQTDPRVTA